MSSLLGHLQGLAWGCVSVLCPTPSSASGAWDTGRSPGLPAPRWACARLGSDARCRDPRENLSLQLSRRGSHLGQAWRVPTKASWGPSGGADSCSESEENGRRPPLRPRPPLPRPSQVPLQTPHAYHRLCRWVCAPQGRGTRGQPRPQSPQVPSPDHRFLDSASEGSLLLCGEVCRPLSDWHPMGCRCHTRPTGHTSFRGFLRCLWDPVLCSMARCLPVWFSQVRRTTPAGPGWARSGGGGADPARGPRDRPCSLGPELG